MNDSSLRYRRRLENNFSSITVIKMSVSSIYLFFSIFLASLWKFILPELTPTRNLANNIQYLAYGLVRWSCEYSALATTNSARVASSGARADDDRFAHRPSSGENSSCPRGLAPTARPSTSFFAPGSNWNINLSYVLISASFCWTTIEFIRAWNPKQIKEITLIFEFRETTWR